MSNYFLSAIIELLNPGNTISAHRMLAHSIGMTETIIYSSLISKQTYYARNGQFREGSWFYSTVCDLQESTTYGAKAQKTAINHLITHGLIECEYKGLPAKMFADYQEYNKTPGSYEKEVKKVFDYRDSLERSLGEIYEQEES